MPGPRSSLQIRGVGDFCYGPLVPDTRVMTMFEDESPIAWTGLPRQTPVVAADGSQIGIAEQVLGDQNEDIFHGLAVKRSSDGMVVELPAARIKRMTERRVVTDLGTSEVASLRRWR